MRPGAALSCPGMTLLDQLKKTFLHRVRGKYPGQLEIGSPSPPPPLPTAPGKRCVEPPGPGASPPQASLLPLPCPPLLQLPASPKRGVAHLNTEHLLFQGRGGRSP